MKVGSDEKEVWFAGCHSDIGGGTATDRGQQHVLSNNSFRWMINEIEKCNSYAPILFSKDTGDNRDMKYLLEYKPATARGYLWLETTPEDFLRQHGLRKLKLSKREEGGYEYTGNKGCLQEILPLSKPPVKGCIYKLPAASSPGHISSRHLGCLEEGYVFVRDGDNSSDSNTLIFLEERLIQVQIVDKLREGMKDEEKKDEYILLIRDTPPSLRKRLVKLCSTIGNLSFALFKRNLYIILLAISPPLRLLLTTFSVLVKVIFYILMVIMLCFGYNPARRWDTINIRSRGTRFWNEVLSFFKQESDFEQKFAFYDRVLGDSLSRAHDQLDHWYWWIIELFPITYYLQQDENNWSMARLRMNMGQGRQKHYRAPLSDTKMIYVHESVRTRIETGTYKPRAWFHITPEKTRNDDPPVKVFKWDLHVNEASGLYEFDEEYLVSKDPEGWGRIEWVM